MVELKRQGLVYCGFRFFEWYLRSVIGRDTFGVVLVCALSLDYGSLCGPCLFNICYCVLLLGAFSFVFMGVFLLFVQLRDIGFESIGSNLFSIIFAFLLRILSVFGAGLSRRENSGNCEYTVC